MEEERILLGKLESTGILAGGIAHDFNNFLGMILGNIDLIKTFDLSAEERNNCLEEARKATQEAKNLAQQLLTLSQGSNPEKIPVSMSDLLQDQISLVLRGSQATFKASIPYNLWTVKADEIQIGQVIRNLVLNALEAMTEGGMVSVAAENVALEVTIPDQQKLRKFVKVSISDDGEGMAPEILSKVFDPYFSTKQRGIQKGMGLGLTICRSIIWKHGGHVDIGSRPGEGTTVNFFLPAYEEPKEKTPSDKEIISGKGRILVMDDEEGMRKMTGDILERLGYEVALVEHGEKAVESYREAVHQGRPFKTILLDLTIRGGMGGKETLKRLLEIDPEIKAIVSSGYSQDPVMQKYEEYGFKGALTKPFFINELGEVISRVMETS
jgi:two-component system, cell cycle sensor histidine kinase and response regulator CckA